jgi:hypothetical protein
MSKPTLVASQPVGLLIARLESAPIRLSFVLGRVTARRVFLNFGRDDKVNTSDMASPATINPGGSLSLVIKESSLLTKFRGVLVGLGRL